MDEVYTAGGPLDDYLKVYEWARQSMLKELGIPVELLGSPGLPVRITDYSLFYRPVDDKKPDDGK